MLQIDFNLHEEDLAVGHYCKAIYQVIQAEAKQYSTNIQFANLHLHY